MVWSSIWEESLMSGSCVGCVPGVLEFSVTLTPNTILTFECVECKIEFDCDTTSFKVLCETAKEAGWLIKWNDKGYDCYCEECK